MQRLAGPHHRADLVRRAPEPREERRVDQGVETVCQQRVEVRGDGTFGDEHVRPNVGRLCLIVDIPVVVKQ